MAEAKINKVKPNVFEVLYFCFFLLLPLVYVGKLVDPVLIPRQLFLSFFISILSLVISYEVYQKNLTADFSFLKLPVFSICGVFIISILISFFQSIAISESIYLLSKISIEILFFIITTYLIIQNKLSIALLTKAVITFSGIALLIAIIQILNLLFSEKDFFIGVIDISSTFGHKNLLASILFLTFPFLINSNSLKKQWKIMSACIAILTLILVWLIQTKAVIIAFLIFFLILLFLLFRNKAQIINKKIVRRGVLSFSLLLIFVSIVTFQNKEKFPRIFDKKSAFERILLWGNSTEMIKENLVFGVGAGNWQIHFPKYGLSKFSTSDVKDALTTFQRPHNDFLWVLCEMGIIGLIAYISSFIVILYSLFKLLKKIKARENAWLYSSLFAVIIGYTLIAFVDFPLERIEHQLLLYLTFSIITAHFYTNVAISKGLSGKVILKLPALFIILFAIPMFSLVISAKRYSGEFHTHKLYYFHHHANWSQMIKEADKARNYYYSIDPTSAPIEWYKGVALFSSGNINDSKISFEHAYQTNPYNIHVLNNLASCYESLKDHKKAEELYLKTLAISSEFEEARLNLSAVYYNTKEYEKAFETINKININSTDPKYQLFLPVILNSWLDNFLSKQKDALVIKRITDVKNENGKIINLYFESVKKGVNLAEYLVKGSIFESKQRF